MTPGAPKVSVLLPVYNGGRYLEAALDSLRRQTFEDFEVVAINDGSTDGSLALLERVARDEPRIRIFSRENRGLIATLNEGIERARGAYVARMDADDIALPDRFRRQVAFLDANPEVVALGTRVLLVDAEGWLMRPFAEKTEHAAIDAAHLEGHGGTIVHPAAMFRAAALRDIGGYDDRYPHAEDLDLFLRLAERGRLANLPDILFHYRQQPDSVGHRHRETQRASAHAAIHAAYERRNMPRKAIEVRSEPASSPADMHRRFAWWSLMAGHPDTARKHARLAFQQNPFNLQTLRLLLVVGRDTFFNRSYRR